MAENQAQPAYALYENPEYPKLRYWVRQAPVKWKRIGDQPQVPGWIPWRLPIVGCYPVDDSDEALRQWFGSEIADMEKAERFQPGLTAHLPNVPSPYQGTVIAATLLVGYLDAMQRSKLPKSEAEKIAREQQPFAALRAIFQRLFERRPAIEGFASSPKPAATAGNEQSEGAGAKPKLLARHLEALHAMIDLKAMDELSRRRTGEIAQKAWGNPDYSLRKQTIAELVLWGMAGSQQGRGGGVWITSDGKSRVRPKHERKR